jgi:hypothetical protein
MFSLKTLKKEMQHIISYDFNGKVLEGGKKYHLHLPSGIPASDFWSIIVYDTLSRLIIHTDQPWPSVFSSSKSLITNNDGSVDVWFGPKPKKKGNWIKTIQGDQWHMILRLYYPLNSWFDKTWRPGEIEEME